MFPATLDFALRRLGGEDAGYEETLDCTFRLVRYFETNSMGPVS